MASTRKKTSRSKSSSARTQRRVTGRNRQAKRTKNESRPKKRSPREIKEVSAGGVVFKKSGNRVHVAMMKDSYGKWTFPKGRVEKGEDIEEAAARETLEELGLEEIRLLETLGKIDIWFRDRFEKDGALVHKDIHYYLFETPKNAELNLDPDERVMAAKWVPLSQVEKVSSYKDMEDVIKEAIALIRSTK